MKKEKKSTALALTILWIVSMAAAYIYYFVEYISLGLTGGAKTAWESSIPFLLMMFYFFPLLLLIHRFAKRDNKERILKFTRIGVPLFGVFSAVAVVILLLMLLA